MRTRRAQQSKKSRVSGRDSREVPPKILTKLRSICLSLPEVREEPAWVGTRWMIRKRNFAHVLKIDAGWPPAYARAAASDGPVVVLTFRTSDALYSAFQDAGPRFFQAEWGTRWGTHVVGIAIDKGVNWEEVELLVVESYRLLAPKRLVAELTRPALTLRRRRRGSPPRARSTRRAHTRERRDDVRGSTRVARRSASVRRS